MEKRQEKTKKDQKKNALKAGIWYTISNISTKAVLIITTPIYTRLMTTADYGIASTFNSWYTLLLVVCSLNLTYSIGRAKIDFPNKLDEYIGSMYSLSFLFTLVVSGIVLIFLSPLSIAMELNKPLLVILLIYLLAAPAVTFKQAHFRYQYRFKGNIAITVYITFATILFTFLFIAIFSGQRYYGKVLGAVIPMVLLSLLFWYENISGKRIHCNHLYWKYGLMISAPLILHTISLNLLAQSDRILITKFCGSDMTGIYTLGYQYAILINIILDSINQAWLPWYHDTFAEGNLKKIREKMKPLLLFGCFMGVGCISLAPEAIFILGGKAYEAGKWVVPPLVLGVICKFIFMQYEHIELHLKKTSYTAIGTCIAAIINLILNILFIPEFGFVAAAYTTLFTYFILMNIHHFITRKILKVNFYDHKYMYLIFAGTFGTAGIFILLFDHILIRFGLIAILSLIYVYYNRKLLKDILVPKLKKR